MVNQGNRIPGRGYRRQDDIGREFCAVLRDVASKEQVPVWIFLPGKDETGRPPTPSAASMALRFNWLGVVMMPGPVMISRALA